MSDNHDGPLDKVIIDGYVFASGSYKKGNFVYSPTDETPRKVSIEDMHLPLEEAQNRVKFYESRIKNEREQALSNRDYAYSKEFEGNMHDACAYWAESLIQLAYTEWRLR